MSLSTGAKLGPYEIQAPLGAGGMGEVYRARDARLGRDVAIKVLPAHLSGNGDLRQRLEREARTISSLSHPHICTLHDIGSQDGVDFLVMEYLEGETLADRLQRGALPLEQLIEIAIEIADALEKAHSRGIIHRDLKPGNIMLTKNGSKLMDFGLAKPAGAVAVGMGTDGRLTPSTPTMTLAALSAPASPLTERGKVVGTFQYMAPEVLQGKEADARSDIFSFGCVLYEMTTAHHAFEGKTQLSVLAAILESEPERVSALRPSSPPRLDETVRRCLAKNPDERYGCMHDVRIQLAAIADSAVDRPIVVAGKNGRTWPAWFAAGVSALIAVALGAAYVNGASAPVPVVRSSILPPPGTTFVLGEPDSAAPVLSPDGSRLAFVARDEKGSVMLYEQALDSLQAQPLNGTDNAMYPFWSPDSRQVGFFTVDRKLKRISASGGPPQIICDANAGRGGAWSKDGTIVFAPSVSGTLLRVSASGGAVEPASKLDATQGENGHRWPNFLPDGRHFIYWARKSLVGQVGSLYVGELGSLDAKVLVRGGPPAFWVPGYLLFVRDQVLMAQPFDARNFALSGDPVPLAEPVVVNEGTNRPIFSASENGRLIYRAGNSSTDFFHLAWMDREAKESDPHLPPGLYGFVTLSPDGTRLAAAVLEGAGAAHINVVDLARGTRTRLTFGNGSENKPVWSPDGRTIYYQILDGGIHARAADGSGEDRIVLNTPGLNEVPIGFSADRNHLLYMRRSADGKSPLDIWSLPLSGDRRPSPVLQSAFDKHEAEVSPDGKWIAYHSDESGQSEVYIAKIDGGAKWQVSTQGGGHAKWRHDGRELFFLSAENSMMAVDVSLGGTRPQLGVPHPLFHAERIERLGQMYDVAANGKKFIINKLDTREEGRPLTLVQNWTAEIRK